MTTRFSSAALGMLALGLLMVGAGCRGSSEQAASNTPTGPSLASFENVTPEQATARVAFVPGTTFVAEHAGEATTTLRTVVIERFAPQETASIRWEERRKGETDASIQARAAARAKRLREPKPVLGDVLVTGSMSGVNLKEAYALYLPAYWPEKQDAPAFGLSGLWLSREVFEGLDRNRQATLKDSVLEDEALGQAPQTPAVKAAFETVRKQVMATSAKTDVSLLRGEKDVVTMPITLNGTKTTVQAIKAHTWYGDMWVLNNKQNPMVLKYSFHPEGVASKEMQDAVKILKPYLDYTVTSMSDVAS